MLGLGFYIHKLLAIISSIIGSVRIKWEDMATTTWENITVNWEEWMKEVNTNVWAELTTTAFESINTNWENIK